MLGTGTRCRAGISRSVMRHAAEIAYRLTFDDALYDPALALDGLGHATLYGRALLDVFDWLRLHGLRRRFVNRIIRDGLLGDVHCTAC